MHLLDTFIAAHRYTPFAWGQHDCCTLAADWVLIATGRDPMHGLRGHSSRWSALRQLRRLGGAHQAGDQLLGHRLPSPGLAMRGDVCLLPSGRRVGRATGYSFGVCLGQRVACPGRDALQMLPISRAEAAWRVC